MDDVIVISRNLKAMEKTLQELYPTAQETGLMISQQKQTICEYVRRCTLDVSRLR